MKQKTKKKCLLFLFTFIFIVLQIVIIRLNQQNRTEFSGVILAMQFVACLFLVNVDHKWGARIALTLLVLGLSLMTYTIVFTQNMSPLPGVCNLMIYLLTLTSLKRQLTIRDKEAVTDYLTELRNRRGLLQYLKEKIEDKNPFHIVYIDIGNFKLVNDNYGHTYGDQILQIISKRMKDIIYKDEVLARIGGDEFVLVLNDDRNVEEMTNAVLDRICEKIRLNLENSVVDIYLTAHAGIASYPMDSKSVESLIQYADIAMYEASKSKTDRIYFFSKDMEEKLTREMELSRLIKEGLKADYFYLVYQPQYKLDRKTLRGFETLIRMKAPDGAMISPGEFIPVAEKNDLILQIDDYVLRRALKEFRDVIEQTKQDVIISVNIFAKNIADLNFVHKVRDILDETGFKAENLELEITEYCLVQSIDITIENIKKLRQMGIQVALDDFGTGYTSLSYLAQMPINLLKLDKSLIDDIQTLQKKQDFVTAVISMGHIMGCEVISEGVEYEEQLAVLNNQSCDYIQGYVWGKPMEYQSAVDLLHN